MVETQDPVAREMGNDNGQGTATLSMRTTTGLGRDGILEDA
jgi:hypothetical protein